MPGSHLAPGRGRFLWEVLRYVLAWVAIVAALVGIFWLLSNVLPVWLESSDDTTVQTQATEPETVPTTVVETTFATTSTTTTTTIPTTTTTVPALRAPQDLFVLVLNSTGRAGLAGGASGILSEAGYAMLVPDNYSTSLTVTRILFAEGLQLEAAALADAFFPGADVLLDTEGLARADADIVVILGADYQP